MAWIGPSSSFNNARLSVSRRSLSTLVPPQSDPRLPWKLTKNFAAMSVLVAVCDASVDTPAGFATSLLDPHVAQIGTGFLCLCMVLSSLFVAPHVVGFFGPKGGLVVGMSLATSYAALFGSATLEEPGSDEQWAVYLLACFCTGTGAGVMWTAQGVFFSNTCAAMSDGDMPSILTSDGESAVREAVTAALGGRFAAVYLFMDVGFKLVASLMQGSVLGWHFGDPMISVSGMFFLFACLSGGAGILVAVFVRAPPPAPASMLKASCAPPAFRLWQRPELWCLGLVNFTFGFCAAFMNGYVNGSLTCRNSMLGVGSIGTLMALTSLTAAGCSLLFGVVAQNIGKGPVIAFGAVAFLVIPTAVLVGKPDYSNDYWGSSLIFLYLLQGVGRSVYESTNRAVFADFFPGSLNTAAFANCIMQAGLAFFLSFMIQAFSNGTVLAVIVLILAGMVVPGHLVARRYRRKPLADGSPSSSLGGPSSYRY